MFNLSIQGLNKYYGENHILKDITFDVFEGERVGLLGKNGAGKTTLFKIIAGLEGYESGTVLIPANVNTGVLDQIPEYPGDYTVKDVLKTAFSRQYNLISEMKKLEAAMESDTSPILVKQYGNLQTEFESAGGYTMNSSIAKVCNGLGISNDLQERKFNLLSGGEKTRVNLGRIILHDADIILLDEPTNHLDVASVEWLEEFLGQYRGTVIVVSHDRYFLDKVVNRIIELEYGKAYLYKGNYSFYTEEKELRQYQKIKKYEQEQKKIKQLEEASKRIHDWAGRSDNKSLHRRAFAIEKRIERFADMEKPVIDKSITAKFHKSSTPGKDVIMLKDVYKAYGNSNVINGVSLAVGRGGKIALIGENGCGKTTLLKIITGCETPDQGMVKVGTSVKYAYLQQDIKFDNNESTMLDAVRYSLGVSAEMARNRLAAFHFTGDDVFKTVNSLSGGEKARLKLCILMYTDVNLLILDEPTNHLDIASREWIEEAISGFDGTVLFVSHDRYFINLFATEIWEMKEGKVFAYHGSYEEYRKWKLRTGTQTVSFADKDGRFTSTTKRKKSGTDNNTDINIKKAKEYEKKISELEEKLKSIGEEMEESASDYQRLDSLFQEKTRITEEINLLYEDWFLIEEVKEGS